ncbi:MAG TPA: GntR family transcriptional regulator, partial [Anaerolineales bacterium]|nr:GntR family transcriptional regulator [Anaerolineales bacterium]
IQKRPLKEDIFDVLHEKIISGAYRPGDWLRQDDIATQLGVSMTPVREALDLLVSAGLAERVPYRGVRVRETSTKDVVEAYGLRLVLEVVIAQEAARKVTQEQVSGLERTIEEMKKHDSLKDMSYARQLSREFHSAIAEATRNDLLIKVYGVVANAFPDWLLYEALFRKPELRAESMATTHEEHTAIVEALKQRDGDTAARISIEHVMESGKWLEDYLDIPAELLREREEQVLFLLKKTSN